MIDQKVDTLQTATPNVNGNPMQNHGGVTINMIEVEEDLNVEKVIISADLENLEKVVVSPTKREKYEFGFITPHQYFASVLKEGHNEKKIDHFFPKSFHHSYQSFPMKSSLGEGINNLFKEGDIFLER